MATMSMLGFSRQDLSWSNVYTLQHVCMQVCVCVCACLCAIVCVQRMFVIVCTPSVCICPGLCLFVHVCV